MDVLELNPHEEDEEGSHRKSRKPRVFAWWLKPWSWHTSNKDRRESRCYDFVYLKVEDDSLEKFMETLTPKRVFIGFSTRLKWLESTKA